MAATAMGTSGMAIMTVGAAETDVAVTDAVVMVAVVTVAVVTDAVVMVAVATAASAQAPISETVIFTVTVHSGPGSPIPAIISHGHRAGETLAPGR
jgi:hypothetical protein